VAWVGLGVLFISYSNVSAQQRAVRYRKKCVDRIHSSFKQHKDAIMGYIYNAPWNDFDIITIRTIYAHFTKFIENPEKGYIDHKIFNTMVADVGLLDPVVRESLFTMLDEARDSKLDFLELVKGLATLCCTRTERLTRLFALADLNKTGNITRHEMRTLLRALKGCESTVEEVQSLAQSQASLETSQIFDFCETQPEGTLTRREFIMLADNNSINFLQPGGFFSRFVGIFGLDLDSYQEHHDQDDLDA